jgi:cytochrome c556
LVPEQEALRLAEIFKRSLGGHDLRARPTSFRAHFEGIIPAAEELAAQVSQARQVDKQGIERAAALMTRIEGSCNSCHEQWRD